MMGRNICFRGVIWKIIPKYPFYPFLSGNIPTSHLLLVLKVKVSHSLIAIGVRVALYLGHS